MVDALLEDPLFYSTLILSFFSLTLCVLCLICTCVASTLISCVPLIIIMSKCFRAEGEPTIVPVELSQHEREFQTHESEEKKVKDDLSTSSIGVKMVLFSLRMEKYSPSFEEKGIVLEDLVDGDEDDIFDDIINEGDREVFKEFSKSFSNEVENVRRILEPSDLFVLAYKVSEKIRRNPRRKKKRSLPEVGKRRRRKKKKIESLKVKKVGDSGSRTRSNSRFFQLLYTILKRLELDSFSKRFSHIALNDLLVIDPKKRDDLASLIPIPSGKEKLRKYLEEFHDKLNEVCEKEEFEQHLNPDDGDKTEFERVVIRILLDISSRFRNESSSTNPKVLMKKFPSNDVLDILEMEREEEKEDNNNNDNHEAIYKTEIMRKPTENSTTARTTRRRRSQIVTPTTIDFFDSESESSWSSSQSYTPIPLRGRFDEKLIVKYGDVINKGTYGTIRIVYLDLGGSTFVKAVEKEIRITKKVTRELIRKEVEILKMLKHVNLLNCFGSYKPLCSSSSSYHNDKGNIIDDEETGEYEKENNNYCQQKCCSSESIILEYCPKGDLYSFKHYLSVEERIRYVFEICSGMKYLHSKNIIHKDLKPQNVMISSNGDCKIGDFGNSAVLAKSQGEEFVDEVSKIGGTIEYLAPELVDSSLIYFPGGTASNALFSNISLRTQRNNRVLSFFEVAKRIDIYSFGILLWELFSLRQPYLDLRKEMNNQQMPMLKKIIKKKMRPKMRYIHLEDYEKKFRGDIIFLKKMMEKCWQHSPLDRPDSFDSIEKECLENIKNYDRRN